MLISMPTGTSTISGVFQVIAFSQVVWRELHAGIEPKSTPDVTQVRKQVRKIEARTPIFPSWNNATSLLDKAHTRWADVDPTNPKNPKRPFILSNVKARANTAEPRPTPKSR
jgi:hypothetical protein